MRARLGYLVRVYVLTVLVFVIAKVVFMLCNHEAVAELSVADV